jgi:hypothetical protein
MTDEPQSLRDIIEERLQAPKPRPRYHHAVVNAVLAGFLAALLVVLIFLIKSIK